jgi:hypothetical protein
VCLGVSFDHYFGTLSGVRGFSDPSVPKNANGTPIFDQYGFQPGTGPTSTGYTQPFHLVNNPPSENGEDTNDIDHSWAGHPRAVAHSAQTPASLWPTALNLLALGATAPRADYRRGPQRWRATPPGPPA